MINLTVINTGKPDALLADLAVSFGLSLTSLVSVINDEVTINTVLLQKRVHRWQFILPLDTVGS